MDGRFATLLTCIDGRIQRHLHTWASRQLAVDYVDTITEPGLDALLATIDGEGLAALAEKVGVSMRAHGSTTVVVAAHSDCAANPVADDEHHRQLRFGLARLAGSLPGVRLIAVHTGRCGRDCWQPVPIAEIVQPRPDSAVGNHFPVSPGQRR